MVDKAPQKIRAMFDQISPRYDFLNHLLSLNTDVLWRRRAAEECGSPRTALDVCCGTGDLALEVRGRWRARVVGLDFSFEMIRIARAKAKRRAEFLQGDALHLPFADARFDAATVAFGIRNVVDHRRGIAEMARVVRPGGRVVILEFTLPPNRLVRGGYLLYFSRVLPKIGKMIAHAEVDAYRYLPDSVAQWPMPDALAETMRGCGLRDVRFTLLTLGIAAIHVGVKS